MLGFKRNRTPSGPKVKDTHHDVHVGHTRVGQQIRERCPVHPWSKPGAGKECWWCKQARKKSERKGRG